MASILADNVARVPTASPADLRAASRVLCYGVTGSGKSSAATEIGAKLGLPVHLVDDEIGWLPGWINRPVGRQIELATQIVAVERWILDSAYGSWLEPVLARTEVIVALDYPRWLSLARLLRRTWQRVRDSQPVCNGNIETWEQALGRDSIIVWHFTSFARKRARIRARLAADTGPKVLPLRHPRDYAKLLREL